jgi:hypothetical protein
MSNTPTADAATAAISQTCSQREASPGIDAMIVATTPTAPIAIPAIPGTAKAPAASIEARI